MTAAHPAQHSISTFKASTQLGLRQAHKSLTLWPLLLREGAEGQTDPPYVSLGTALETGVLAIDEVGESGRVPNVRVQNKGDVAVLFLFGEEIRGAKQNRVANASFLVPEQSELVLDVSCVEAGRWHRRAGERFHASGEVLSNAIRRKMAGKVAQARAQGHGFHADQAEVWQEIGERISFSHVSSDTSAYADYRESRATDLDELARAFHTLEGQLGFVACIGDEVAGVEVIGRPEVFRASFQALLRAYAIDAVDAALVKEREAGPRASRPHFDAPEPFLAALAEAPATRGPSLGLGEDLRLEGQGVAGCALVHKALVHLTAFPAQGS